MARTGRPATKTIDERRELIFALAENLFGERGYEKVTMADIAAAAGMSKRTLYGVFAEKEELLRELIKSSYIWPSHAFGAFAGDPVSELRLRLRTIANHVLSPRHIKLCRLAISENLSFPGLADAFVEMGIERSRASLVQSTANIDPRLLRVQLPPELLSDMLYGATCGRHLITALLTGKHKDIESIHQSIDQVVDALLQ